MPKVEYVEDVIVVWLDQSPNNKLANKTSTNQLKQTVNCVKVFIDSEKCLTFMSGLKNEKVLIVLSGLVEETFVSNVHDDKKLESIYVFSPGKAKTETWFDKYPEISGVYTSLVSLSDQLSKDVKSISYNLVGFEIVEKSSSKSNQQDAAFMYDQLFQDIVLAESDENMQDMFEFCEQQYRGNDKEQKFLKELKTKYNSKSPIWWYTCEAFLYRIMNKALREHQYDLLYLLRVFIRHLHQEIAKQQRNNNVSEMTLYRGQAMEKDEFERLRASEGGLLSVSNFLSTSADRDIGLWFANEALKDTKKVSILMEIKLGKNSKVPAANITGFSAIPKEQEWLFSMGSVFRIGSLKKLPEGIWVVPLTLTDDQDKQLHDLKQHMQKSMCDSNSCLNFASLMCTLAAWSKAEYFYLKALESETAWQRRSVLLNNIGLAKGELGKPDEALHYYLKSLELKDVNGSNDKADKASTYNNIATLYYELGKMDLAVFYYQKAIEAANTEGNTNQGLMATLLTNIATIISDQGKYDEALEKSEEAFGIRKQIFPDIHPDIASSYGTIGNIMYKKGSYEKAIEYMEKAVEIDQKVLLIDHPQLILHSKNLATFKRQQQQQQSNQ